MVQRVRLQLTQCAVAMGDDDATKRKKSKKDKKHSRKRSKKSSSDRHRRSSSSSSSSSEDSRRRRKEKKKLKKEKRRAEREETAAIAVSEEATGSELKSVEEAGPSVTLAEPGAKPKGPMTREQWEAQRNTLHRVFDAETGRMRLIRGDGEIVEEIVSRQQHIAINKAATKADGAYFETVLGLKRHK